MDLRIISNITKEYPEMFKIVVYKEPKVFVKSDSVKRKREVVPDYYSPAISSLQRTKSLIRDIVLCNDFELFCTFTFDPRKVDSFSLPVTWGVMSRWLHHPLISGYSSTLKATNCVTPSLHRVYNITSFRSGFTTAVFIDSKEGVSNYVTKYITKDFVTTFNQRRFFCSRNLVRPKRSTNSLVLSTTLPLFRRKVSENSQTETFIIDKSNYICNNEINAHNVAQYRF